MDMEKSARRAIRNYRIKQGILFALTAFFMLMAFSPSPLEPDVPRSEWNSLGFLLTIACALVYVLNVVVGPDYEDNT
jgi:multisubunit Na+/H+ antiporter MnhB subunit